LACALVGCSNAFIPQQILALPHGVSDSGVEIWKTPSEAV